MKEVSPKMYTKMPVSGNFKSWAKDMKDYLFWHGRSIKGLSSTLTATGPWARSCRTNRELLRQQEAGR